MELVEAMKEIRFVYYLLVILRISIKLPIILRTDSIGTISMDESPYSGFLTRHMNIRYDFIFENLEDG
jgi:hypothetical protein